ncbi:metal ABC transporter substrate-binding protein [Candidatus Bathyarchaeota archaeon]|nr:metal ABC transporter substrate-binding protein [Candidatus Bathyarchaeota archaeon]MBS7627756.1 metal ABC transporter substrate-binding protein [Candidatus Bathyarchaeota archaeon]
MLPKKVISILIIMAFVEGLGISSPTAKQDSDSDTIRIVVTMDILQSIVFPIIEGEGEVSSILYEGAEPHGFILTPRDIDKARNSDLIVITGHMEWEEKLVVQVSDEKKVPKESISLNLLNLSGIKILELDGQRNFHGFWLLPDNALTIARALKEKLSLLKPEASGRLSSNYEAFEREISSLKEFLRKISGKKGVSEEGLGVVIGFYAEQYIAEAMGLRVEAVLVGEGESIRPESLRKIYDGLRSGRYPCMIVSDSALRMENVERAIEEISKETGSPIAYVLAVSRSGLRRYESIIYYNAGQVSGALLSRHEAPSLPFDLYFFTTILCIAIIVLETLLLFWVWGKSY